MAEVKERMAGNPTISMPLKKHIKGWLGFYRDTMGNSHLIYPPQPTYISGEMADPSLPSPLFDSKDRAISYGNRMHGVEEIIVFEVVE